jgi:hypothetical protein
MITEIKKNWRDKPNIKDLIKIEIFDRRPDKSGKPYWNPMRKAGQVRCLKLDSLICKTGYSGFDRIDTL